MLERTKEFIKSNSWIQFLPVLVAGIAIGAIFYPTKHIEERERQKHELETKILNETHAKELSQVRDTLDKVNQQSNEYRKEAEVRISKLTAENSTLKSKVKTAYYKVVRPDGTIEIKKFTESEVDESRQVITSIQQEFKEKIASIENRWETIHRERVTAITKEFNSKEESYKRQIDELERRKVVDVNKKSFGVEVGVMTNASYYGHVSYDVFGPVFIGGHAQFGSQNGLGTGIGLRF